jgi:dipeptidyl aminopeptidase/acylaminoacyl peptidase
MSKRRFQPEDALALRTPADPDLSQDGRRVAFALAEVDAERDRMRSSIWVVPADGSAPPRRFSEGPADRSARWSADGCWLAYISVADDKPAHAHLRLAPLDGGAPWRLGELPGPVLQFACAPDSKRIVAVCQVGLTDHDKSSAQERNAPRRVRRLASRLDGVGWLDGRRHLFVIDVPDGSVRQLTRGEFDHADPSFSPDGTMIAFSSDRSRRRDDRHLRADVWVVPAAGGRPRRLTDGSGSFNSPLYSPDGGTVACAGRDTDKWDADTHAYVIDADAGSAAAQLVAPQTDRPVLAFPGSPAAICWIGNDELAMLVADRGRILIHRARVGQPTTRELVSGETQVDGFSARVGRRAVAFTASWPDRPGELFIAPRPRTEPVALTHFNDKLVDEVALAPVSRASITRPDGTEIEYFMLAATDRAPRRRPLHLDIHGGPHGVWPSGRWLGLHQAIAAAGYAVLLPNPRGSFSYGQEFTSACTGDWGGGDYEDIIACCDDVIERAVVDEGRMFVSGGSYGGFMTSWIVSHTDRFKAASALAAVVDMTSMALTSDVPDFALYSMGGTPWQRPDEYAYRSPLTYLPSVSTPVLVVHWEGDLRVPIGQGEELYSGLRVLGKEAELLRYPGGFHASRSPSQAVDMTKQIIDFNRRHDPRVRG